MHLAQIIDLIGEGKGLSEVRWAYKDYCTLKVTSWMFGDRLEPVSADESDCPLPATWDKEQAKRVLLSDAPLSASQLQELHVRLSPESAEATSLAGSHNEVLTDAELARRPNGFGEAWLRLLAQNKRVLSKKGVSRTLAERFEALAQEGSLRVADGTWDLAAAGEIFVQEEGIPFSNTVTTADAQVTRTAVPEDEAETAGLDLDQVVEADGLFRTVAISDHRRIYRAGRREFKCCVSSKTGRAIVQDITAARLPRNWTWCADATGCGCMFGDAWHSFHNGVGHCRVKLNYLVLKTGTPAAELLEPLILKTLSLWPLGGSA